MRQARSCKVAGARSRYYRNLAGNCEYVDFDHRRLCIGTYM
jgi:hypothetical protein